MREPNIRGKKVCRNVIVHLADENIVCYTQHDLNKVMSNGIVMETYDNCIKLFPDPPYQPDMCLCPVDIKKTASVNGYRVEFDLSDYHFYKIEQTC